MQEFEDVEEEDGTCCPEGRVTRGLGCGDTSVGLAAVITCTGKTTQLIDASTHYVVSVRLCI